MIMEDIFSKCYKLEVISIFDIKDNYFLLDNSEVNKD